MSGDFSRQGSRIIWATSSGPIFLSEATARGLLSIFCKEHDALLREGLRAEARPLRGLILDLGGALTGIPELPSSAPKSADHLTLYFDGRSAA